MDRRVEVFSCALADFDGVAEFFITNNSVSSSLLKLGQHLEVFPHVAHDHTVSVEVRTIGSLIKSRGLLPPDFLFMDAQGAEIKIISGIPEHLLEGIRLIYTEASLEELYAGSGTLEDIKRKLEGRFLFCGFEPLPGYPVHGDALFVNRAFHVGGG